MPNFVSTANFSSANSGLSTVGYTIYNLDGTLKEARTTSGVVELGLSTGIYRTIITYPPFFQGFVLWDTGAAIPVYASESINPQDADPVLDGVRTQLRSLNTSLSAFLQKYLKPNDLDPLKEAIEELSMNIQMLNEMNESDDYHDDSKIIEAIKTIDVQPVININSEIQEKQLTSISSKLISEMQSIKESIEGRLINQDSASSSLIESVGLIISMIKDIDINIDTSKLEDIVKRTKPDIVREVKDNLKRSGDEILKKIEVQQQQIKDMKRTLANDLKLAESKISALLEDKATQILTLDDRRLLERQAEMMKNQRYNILVGIS